MDDFPSGWVNNALLIIQQWRSYQRSEVKTRSETNSFLNPGWSWEIHITPSGRCYTLLKARLAIGLEVKWSRGQTVLILPLKWSLSWFDCVRNEQIRNDYAREGYINLFTKPKRRNKVNWVSRGEAESRRKVSGASNITLTANVLYYHFIPDTRVPIKACFSCVVLRILKNRRKNHTTLSYYIPK